MAKERKTPFSHIERWKHYSFLGGTARARMTMEAIGHSITATDDTKRLARRIFDELCDLQAQLSQMRETRK